MLFRSRHHKAEFSAKFSCRRAQVLARLPGTHIDYGVRRPAQAPLPFRAPEAVPSQGSEHPSRETSAMFVSMSPKRYNHCRLNSTSSVRTEFLVLTGYAPNENLLAGPTFAPESASNTRGLCRISVAANFSNSELQPLLHNWPLWACTVAGVLSVFQRFLPIRWLARNCLISNTW